MNDVITYRSNKVRVIASPKTWVEGEAIRQLDVTAELPGMISVAGMPDIHPGKGGPNGAAYVSKGYIHPTLVGSDIGCGIAVWKTDLQVRKAKPDKLTNKVNGLDSPWDGDTAKWLEDRGLEPTAYDSTLGTPGRGNHFIELQAVEEIIDNDTFKVLGLEEDLVTIVVHSGSRGLGESVLLDYTGKHKAAPLPDIDAESYLAAHNNAVKWAKSNRDLCALRMCEAIRTEITPVIDVCHNSVTEAIVDGCSCWIHRKGAAPADKGPVLIPGSRGDLSWLVSPVLGNEVGLRSLAHGAGRKIARGEVKGKIKNKYDRESLRKNKWGGKVVCGEDLLAWEEAPEAYKPVSSVINDLTTAGLIIPIAAFRPIVTFKTSEVETDENRRDPKEWQQERRQSRENKYRNFK